MQNNSNIYTINETAPPSYAEATGSSTSRIQDSLHQTQSPQFDQRYPHMIVCPTPSAPYPYSSNCYVNRPLGQSTYPENESAWQRQSMNVPHNGTFVVETTEDNTDCIACCRVLWVVCILVSIIGGIFAIIYRVRH